MPSKPTGTFNFVILSIDIGAGRHEWLVLKRLHIAPALCPLLIFWSRGWIRIEFMPTVLEKLGQVYAKNGKFLKHCQERRATCII